MDKLLRKVEKLSKIRILRNDDFRFDTEKIKVLRFRDLDKKPLHQCLDTACILRSDRIYKSLGPKHSLKNTDSKFKNYFKIMKVI